MNKRFVVMAVGALAVGVVIGVLMINRKNGPLLNPVGWWNPISEKKKKKIEVVGFLPTWMVGKTRTYGKELSQMVFLGVEVRADGSLVWDNQSKKIDGAEYAKLKEEMNKSGGKNILGIKLFEDKKIDQLLSKAEARKRLLDEVEVVATMGKFAGVNIDFEYMNDPLRITNDDFLAFLEEIRMVNWGEISIDVFANTIIKGNKERLDKLGERVDKIIVMAYDFHRPGADFAGPVAPVGAGVGERSISEISQKIVEFGLEKEKIIMAYPLYGYEWETINDEWGSPTVVNGYGRTVFYYESVGFTGVKWDDLSMSPWITRSEEEQRSKISYRKIGKKTKKVTSYYTVNQMHQAYFENEKSLAAKIDLAIQTDLGGVGFWALGYEGKESSLIYDLRNMISTKADKSE